MDIIGLGDNVVDKYEHQRTAYPGGNALNVAVLSKRLGAETGYLGVVGTDSFGEHVRRSLIVENVDTSRLEVREGANRYAQVDLIDGDRKFIGGDLGVSLPLNLNDDAYAYLSRAEIVHTSIYSGLEDQLKRISGAAKKLSFDFSNRWTLAVLQENFPLLSYAFLSASGRKEEDVSAAIRIATECSLRYLVVTNGEHGATLYNGGSAFHQPARPVQVIDTLGAGDAFISALLVGEVKQQQIEESLKQAAEYASKVCAYYGAFGYGLSY